MAATASLGDRIKAEFSSRTARLRTAKEEHARKLQERDERLKLFTQACERLSAVWKPRLEEFAKQFGEQIKAKPSVTPGQRQVKFLFTTDLAGVTLTLTVSPDPDLQKLAIDYDLSIIPMLLEYQRYARLEMPVDKIDEKAVGAWLDDRLVECVRTYLSLQDNQYYLKRLMVEDPITKVSFVRADAVATLEHEGQTYYFANEASLKQFKERMQIKT
jgi:YHS domain-containing protein